MIDFKASKISKELSNRNERKVVYDGIKKFDNKKDNIIFDQFINDKAQKMQGGELKIKL